LRDSSRGLQGEAAALRLLFKNLESFCFDAKFSSENLIV
jgi:hypothetical protein